MMRPLVPLLVAVSALTAACGDLSSEDLVFRAAIPAKEAVEVRPAGAESDADAAGTRRQAMEADCLEFDIKCHARRTSRDLNAITFFLLDLVDAIVAFPPSERSRGRRVWGPHFDFGNGSTSRFEMVRTDGGATFRFCLHSVAGRIDDRDARDVTCDTDVDENSGLTLLLLGEFSPGDLAGARARTGVGNMLFHTGRLPDELAAIGRTMDIGFDNDEGETNVSIVVEGQRDDASVDEREPITYDFHRDVEGAGTFGFTMFANINAANENRPAVERLDIVALWDGEQAGRALAQVTEGDLGAEVFTVDQCWDADDEQVYRDFSFTNPLLPLPDTEGDEGLCAFPVEEVEALLDER